MMLAVLFTVYDMNTRGYISTSLGFFAKIFPIVAMPFIVLYNAKTNSLKAEILSAGKILLILCAVLLLPLAIINPNAIQSYIFTTGGSVGIYANTATYTLYANLNEVLHLGISSGLVSLFMYGGMAVALLFLLYVSYISEERDPNTLKITVMCNILARFFHEISQPLSILYGSPPSLLCLLLTIW